MLWENVKTGERGQQDFVKRNASEIQWDNKKHIKEIHDWHNQIYLRGGVKKRKTQNWKPKEEFWVELYYHVSIAETRRRTIRRPRKNAVGQEFLDFFASRKVMNRYGENVQRDMPSFSGKFGRRTTFPQLRQRLAEDVMGTTGDGFMPTFTVKVINRFRRLKAVMAAKDVQIDSVDFLDSSKWEDLFLNPSSDQSENDTVVDDEKENLDDPIIVRRSVEGDIDAAATLISMAFQPNGITAPATPVTAALDSEIELTPDVAPSSPHPSSSVGRILS
jgi:hypothetical protein